MEKPAAPKQTRNTPGPQGRPRMHASGNYTSIPQPSKRNPSYYGRQICFPNNKGRPQPTPTDSIIKKKAPAKGPKFKTRSHVMTLECGYTRMQFCIKKEICNKDSIPCQRPKSALAQDLFGTQPLIHRQHQHLTFESIHIKTPIGRDLHSRLHVYPSKCTSTGSGSDDFMLQATRRLQSGYSSQGYLFTTPGRYHCKNIL
ncbi:hypothetical protein Nepgr_031288 [Nepenthes gracilis]|uniref:Uncharacterized protein n=1 Tax=Nepenthes gracilis TaxID=150966 RepID=A0AAD3Y6N8_NEPGR|nr:hypothetical protein Nepgr_031288 [Nepenthes gracilis]